MKTRDFLERLGIHDMTIPESLEEMPPPVTDTRACFRKFRTALSLSQDEVARVVGISQRSYSRWEEGARVKSMTPAAIKQLDDFFDKHPGWGPKMASGQGDVQVVTITPAERLAALESRVAELEKRFTKLQTQFAKKAKK